MSTPLFIGVDVGTSGARAVAIDGAGQALAFGSAPMAASDENPRAPETWRAAVRAALARLLAELSAPDIRAIAVDGTSGTVLPVDRQGRVLAEPLMYNDPVTDRTILETIARTAPAESAAHGPTAGLAKAILLSRTAGAERLLHQADWIAGELCGRYDTSDENNALKSGYDPVGRRWPDWMAEMPMPVSLLPEVVEPGTPIGEVTPEAARAFGLTPGTLVVAGTTDGCASFLATGAAETGDGVTALGSTLTVKMLCERPVFAPEYGLYSHRLGERWLAGGASNTGGGVIAAFFTPEDVANLSRKIDPERPSGLDYYPLPCPGERFPFNDPAHAPRLSPRPDDPALFLQGILEGIAGIEALAYRRLAELGAPPLRSVRTVGGGAGNAVWTRIRERLLSVRFAPARSHEAAHGTALLALKGANGKGYA